jgi:hypothetical protein
MLDRMGQHLYVCGKEQISLRLAALFRDFFNTNVWFMLACHGKMYLHQDTNSDCFNSYVSKTEIRETPAEEIAKYTKDGMVKQCQLST